MKRLFTLLVALLLAAPAWAQSELKPIAQEVAELQRTQGSFTPRNDLFTLSTAPPAKGAHLQNLRTVVAKSDQLELLPASLSRLLAEAPTTLALRLPTAQGPLELELYQINPLAEGFSVVTSGGESLAQTPGVHYRGIIKGDDQSLVAISLYPNEVMGLIANGQGSRVLGRAEEAVGNTYVLYADKDLKQRPDFKCGTSSSVRLKPSAAAVGSGLVSTKCVRLYWEADYSLFQQKGSSTTTLTNYLLALFNQSKIIFDNDGINVKLSQIFVWTTPDPYGSSDSSSFKHLLAFTKKRPSFNGDLANLISSDGGGGIASVGGLCTTEDRYCYSGIEPTFENFPTFSYTVQVVTHEEGHLLGSQHTHACVWNGNNTAIDNCVPTQGGCASVEGPTPAGGGTIMSYCAFGPAGTNFTKGFGPQPRQRIINYINSSACLVASCGTPAPAVTLTDGAVYKMVVRHSGKVAEVAGKSTANGAPVQQQAYNGGLNQQWRARSVSGGYWQFVNLQSGKCLDVTSVITGSGAHLQQRTWVGAYIQQWRLQDAGQGRYYVVNRRTGLVMDVGMASTANGAPIQQWISTQRDNQKWRFELLPATAAPAGLAAYPAPGEATGLQVAPNPARGDIKLRYYASQPEEVVVSLYDARGVQTYRQPQAVVAGPNELLVPAGSLLSGLYIVRIGQQRAKVMLER